MPQNDRRRLAWVWADRMQQRNCRGPRCGAPITMVRLMKSGRALPIDGAIEYVALRDEPDPVSGRRRVAGLIDLDAVHFARCPDAEVFRRDV